MKNVRGHKKRIAQLERSPRLAKSSNRRRGPRPKAPRAVCVICIEPREHFVVIDEHGEPMVLFRREPNGYITAMINYLGEHHSSLSDNEVSIESHKRLLRSFSPPPIPVPPAHGAHEI
jgi:hypothetical protein